MLTKEETKSDVPGLLICPICGKQFRKPLSSIYKRRIRGTTWEMCSYTCYEKFKVENRCRK